MIYNRERFQQAIDFTEFPTFATDVDSLTYLKGKLWLACEAKCQGSEVPRGQDRTLRALVKALGQETPAYMAIAHHDTDASDDVQGDDLLVSTVYYSSPALNGRVVVHEYPEYARPTYTLFCWGALVVHNAVKQTKPKAPDPDYRHALVMDHNPFCGYPGAACEDVSPEYLLAKSHEHLMWQFAALDNVDDEFLSQDLKALMAASGYENDVVNFTGDVFYEWSYAT